MIMLISHNFITWRQNINTSINSMSRYLGTIFILPAPIKVDKKKNTLMTKLEL